MKLRPPIDNIGLTHLIQITQRFGENHLDYSQFGLKGHNGWDISAPKGTPVKAMADGYIVERLGKDTGYGLRLSQMIPIPNSDRDWLITYGHFDRFSVNDEFSWYQKMIPVKEGDVIGFVDSTGFSTGNHLHFSLYEYDKAGKKLHSDNGYGGAIDPAPHMKIRVPKWVGYRKHPQKDSVLTWPSLEVRDKVLAGELKLTDVFYFEEEYTFTLPYDRPPYL